VEENSTIVYLVGVAPDGRVLRGEQTRAQVLMRAMDIASVEGLDGLSIGRLAGELEVSKSGVFARFGSKEELQLATVAAAREVFVDRVVAPALRTPPGIERLWRLCDGWLSYARSRVFPGGCFFFAAAAEYDARPGRVHDAVAATLAEWTALLERAAEDARQLGQLQSTCDARQLAFEVDALGVAANARAVLHDDDTAYELASTGIRTRLTTLATIPLPD
jgi:AcrR family transcriptional regulator